MKRIEPMAVGDILRAMMESGGDTAAFDRQKISYLWGEIAGQVINRHTIKRYVDGATLHVFIDSAPLKSELAYMVPGMVDELNKAVGKNILTKISIH